MATVAPMPLDMQPIMNFNMIGPGPSVQKMTDGVNIRGAVGPRDRQNYRTTLIHHVYAHEKRSRYNCFRGLCLPGADAALSAHYAAALCPCCYLCCYPTCLQLCCVVSCLFCPNCLCCPKVDAEERKNFYIQIYDNKIEYNEPAVKANCPCYSCIFSDNVRVAHMDRLSMTQASKAGNCCSPGCSHPHMFPDCCGCFGEALVIHTTHKHCCCEATPGCCRIVNQDNNGAHHMCCCGCPTNTTSRYMMFVGVDDAAAAAAAFNQVRSTLPPLPAPFPTPIEANGP